MISIVGMSLSTLAKGNEMLSEDQVRRFHRDGFVKGGRVLGDAEIEELQEEVMRVIRDKDDPRLPQSVRVHNLASVDAPVWQIVNIWQASDNYARLIRNPQITEEIAELTSAAELRIWHDQIQYKPAATGGVNMWHQDAPLWPILTPMTQVTAWVALDDVDVENGCMSMVPGSHRWGDRQAFLSTLKSFTDMPAEFDGHAVEIVDCPVRRGEVHFHHALTWHGSRANTSGRPRRAIAMHFMTDETRYVAAGDHIMKRFVNVADGEVLSGLSFPLVWSASGGTA